jgi:formylglycine-generating enzyme required for sulfatase activity
MVHAQHPDFPAVSFCIDRTEVTQAQYVSFLIAVDGDVANTDQPSACAFNTALTRGGAGSNCPTFTVANDLPVNCVDWCDAYAYCAWAGKRLCGTLEDGGPLAFDAPVTTDEWHFACSGGFQTTYPYGDEPEICACYLPEEWQDKMMCAYEDITNLNYKAPVGSHPDCEGGFPGIFDMQGNASEWTNRCQPGDGSGDELCVLRGGTTYSVNGSAYYRCDLLDQTAARNDPATDPGIRCCRDADTP